MKINLFLVVLSLLVSCSQKKENTQKNNNNVSEEIVFEALSVKTSLVGGINTIPVSSLDFATLQPKQSASQDLIITNGDLSPLIFGSNDIVATDISPFVMTESCSNKSIARNRSCKLSFSITNSPSPIENVLTKSLTIKGTQIQLTATLAPDLTPPTVPNVSLIVSPSILDFGSMKVGELKELSIAVTNKGTTTQSISAPVLSNPNISLTSNTCSNLLRNRACSMKFTYTGTSDVNVSQETFSSIANNEIKYSVLIETPVEPVPEVLNINSKTPEVNLSLADVQNQVLTATFTNNGTTALPSPIQVVANPQNAVTISSVSCSGGLSRGRTCNVTYTINSSQLPSGQTAIDLRLQSGTFLSNPQVVNVNNSSSSIVAIGNFNFFGLMQPPEIKYFYNLPNGDKIFFNINQSVYNSDLNIIEAPGSTDLHLFNGTSTSIVKNIPQIEHNNVGINELINNKYLFLIGNYAETPSINKTQMRLVDITNAYSDTLLLNEEMDSIGQISGIVKYNGSNNDDKILFLSKRVIVPPYNYKLYVSNSTYTGFTSILESSEFSDSMQMSDVYLNRTTQIGDKLVFSLTGKEPISGNTVYSLYSFNGNNLTKVYERIMQTQNSNSYGNGFLINSVVKFNDKVYQMVSSSSGCDSSNSNPCFVESFLIESDGTIANTQVVDNFSHSFIPGQPSSGQELFENGYTGISVNPKILGSSSGGLVYSWFNIELQSGFDYSDMNQDPQLNPCSNPSDFICANLNYKQQLGKTVVKKISSTGVKTDLLEISTKYGYNFNYNPLNNSSPTLEEMGSAFNEVHFIKKTENETFWYKTNSTNNSVTLVEDLRQTLGFMSNSSVDIYTGLLPLGLSDIYFSANINNEVKLYRKNGTAPTVSVTDGIITTGSYKLLDNKIYFDSYENGFQTTKLNYIQNGIVVPVVEYPNPGLFSDIIGNDIFLYDYSTVYIYR